MEQRPPHNGDDRTPNVPALEPGEIDLAGRIRQDEALRSVIGDAIVEAESSGGVLPDWGARALARALADRLSDPTTGDLHHFAATGRADREAIARELADLYAEAAADDEIRDWADRLDTYVVDVPDKQAEADRTKDSLPTNEVPFDGTPLEKVSAFLRIAFTEADARGEAISTEDAQAVATLLGALLGPSEMARFAQTGAADHLALQTECHYLRSRTWETPDVGLWVERFEQYLAEHAEPDIAPKPASPTDADAPVRNPQIEQGTHQHGDAFQAYLRLPDVDPNRDNLLQTFRDVYISSYPSMGALLNELTEIGECVTALNEVAKSWGFDGLASLDRAAVEGIAQETWDIVALDGRFHVFNK